MSIIYTPLHIQMLFHYYGQFTDYRELEAPAVDETIKSFTEHGLIQSYEVAKLTGEIDFGDIDDAPKHVITDKGRCYAEHILNAITGVSLPTYTCKIGSPKFVIRKNINDLFDENGNLDIGPSQIIVSHAQFDEPCPHCGEMAIGRFKGMEEEFWEHQQQEADDNCPGKEGKDDDQTKI